MNQIDRRREVRLSWKGDPEAPEPPERRSGRGNKPSINARRDASAQNVHAPDPMRVAVFDQYNKQGETAWLSP